QSGDLTTSDLCYEFGNQGLISRLLLAFSIPAEIKVNRRTCGIDPYRPFFPVKSNSLRNFLTLLIFNLFKQSSAWRVLFLRSARNHLNHRNCNFMATFGCDESLRIRLRTFDLNGYYADWRLIRRETRYR